MVAATDELKVERLSVSFPAGEGFVRIVNDVSFTFTEGLVTCIVGESGCGKSVFGQAVLASLPEQVLIEGKVLYQGGNVLLTAERPREYYGRIMGVVPQSPNEALNPIRLIGRQFRDVLEAAGQQYDEAKVLAEMELFGLKEGKRFLSAYPHELSGGQLQRVLCAMATITGPRWILADEPTKGLDEQVSQVVRQNLQIIRKKRACGMIIITHDLQLAEELGDQVAVMYAGTIVEQGRKVLQKPCHPYTRALLAALPQNGFQTLPGNPPVPGEKMQGCCFAPRCSCRSERCSMMPQEFETEQGKVRCWLYA